MTHFAQIFLSISVMFVVLIESILLEAPGQPHFFLKLGGFPYLHLLYSDDRRSWAIPGLPMSPIPSPHCAQCHPIFQSMNTLSGASKSPVVSSQDTSRIWGEKLGEEREAAGRVPSMAVLRKWLKAHLQIGYRLVGMESAPRKPNAELS